MHADELSLRVQPGPRDQAVDVGVEKQALVPGVQDGGEAVEVGVQALLGGELLGQRAGHGAKEQIESLLGLRAQEALAQLGREGEADQEAGRVDPFGQLALNPVVRGLTTALRAGLVIAGVPGEVDVAALLAGKGLPAQSRGAAMGDGPEGATLVRGQRRGGVQEGGQKLTQRSADGGAHGSDQGANRFSEAVGDKARP